MKRLGLILLIFFVTATTQAAVWDNKNNWSPEWEKKFQEWIQTSWQVDFFSRKTLPDGQSNPYYGIQTDCADTVYTSRIIFAYENRLPFVIRDPSAAGRTLSNQMSRFDSQPNIQRFKSFLNYLYDIVNTRSLPNDTYPVAITRETVVPGGMILTAPINHHVWGLKEMLPIGVPDLIFYTTFGSVSKPTTLQQRRSWPSPEWVFEGNSSPSGHAGLRYWRPIAYINQPVWKTPGYSEEQYRIPLDKWLMYVRHRLTISAETDEQMITRLMKSVCDGFAERVQLVRDGLAALDGTEGCMAYDKYDTYSTPNRDQRIFDDLIVLRDTYQQMIRINDAQNLTDNSTSQLNKLFPSIDESVTLETKKMKAQDLSRASICETEFMPGHYMDIAEFKRRLFAGLISNNPMDSAPYRWGELRGPSKRAKDCKSWDVWTPNLNQ